MSLTDHFDSSTGANHVWAANDPDTVPGIAAVADDRTISLKQLPTADLAKLEIETMANAALAKIDQNFDAIADEFGLDKSKIPSCARLLEGKDQDSKSVMPFPAPTLDI